MTNLVCFALLCWWFLIVAWWNEYTKYDQITLKNLFVPISYQVCRCFLYQDYINSKLLACARNVSEFAINACLGHLLSSNSFFMGELYILKLFCTSFFLMIYHKFFFHRLFFICTNLSPCKPFSFGVQLMRIFWQIRKQRHYIQKLI
jgi:hypothetical protein